MNALNAGCGDTLFKDWINVDIKDVRLKQFLTPDYPFLLMNLENEFPFDSNYFDYIYSEHLIEHLSYYGFKTFMMECYRCLKPGGIMRVAWPKLEFLIDLWLHSDQYKDYIENHCENFNHVLAEDFNGGKNVPAMYVINENYRSWGHQIMYDIPTLKMLIKNFGFKNIKEVEYCKSDHPVLCNLELGNKRGTKMNKLETAVLECEKL